MSAKEDWIEERLNTCMAAAQTLERMVMLSEINSSTDVVIVVKDDVNHYAETVTFTGSPKLLERLIACMSGIKQSRGE